LNNQTLRKPVVRPSFRPSFRQNRHPVYFPLGGRLGRALLPHLTRGAAGRAKGGLAEGGRADLSRPVLGLALACLAWTVMPGRAPAGGEAGGGVEPRTWGLCSQGGDGGRPLPHHRHHLLLLLLLLLLLRRTLVTTFLATCWAAVSRWCWRRSAAPGVWNSTHVREASLPGPRCSRSSAGGSGCRARPGPASHIPMLAFV
jgi:hypothetical protein